jgi:hypothetical protein
VHRHVVAAGAPHTEDVPRVDDLADVHGEKDPDERRRRGALRWGSASTMRALAVYQVALWQLLTKGTRPVTR